MSVRFKASSKNFDSGLCVMGLNLLAHAQCIELDVGSRCGGHGICGGDRVRIPFPQKGVLSAPTSAECEHLSDEELAQGYRLACQCFPQGNDLELEVEIGP